MILGIFPCVVIISLETGAFTAIIACLDMVMVRRLNASAGHEKNSQDAPGTKFQFGKEKGPSGAVIQQGEPHERNLCAPKFEERTPEETSPQEEYARQAAWNLATYIYIYIYI